MNIVSNFIFHCNNCDANRVFVEFPKALISMDNLMQNLRLRGVPTNDFSTDR